MLRVGDLIPRSGKAGKNKHSFSYCLREAAKEKIILLLNFTVSAIAAIHSTLQIS